MPLGGCLCALQPGVPLLTRSKLHPCLQLLSIAHLPNLDVGQHPKQKFSSQKKPCFVPWALTMNSRLKTFKDLTPCRFICKCWTIEPERFRLIQLHKMLRLNTRRKQPFSNAPAESCAGFDYLCPLKQRRNHRLRPPLSMGRPIATALFECEVNSLVARRMVKKPQMQWSKRGADRLLRVRAAVLNNDLRECLAYKPPRKSH